LTWAYNPAIQAVFIKILVAMLLLQKPNQLYKFEINNNL